MTVENVLLVSAALFALGAYGAVSRSSLITVIMSLELMFNAVVLAAVAFSRFTPSAALDSCPAFCFSLGSSTALLTN